MLISYIWYLKDTTPFGKLQCKDAFFVKKVSLPLQWT